MIALPFLFHFVFLSVYALLVFALLWHYRRYSLLHDPARFVIGPFLFFSVIFALGASALLFYAPWDALVSGALLQLSVPSY
ncbi:MAG: hypothetical protein HYT22_00725 [Candidatus Niyogibacteria bacterium]|nr:hypothetical protein [Candidatus Niyogibacteria bacterium]